jgi:hypothetical protein
MKKIIGTLMIAFVAMTGAGKAAAQEVSTGAKIEFEQDVHNYGELKHGGNGVCYFEFTNTGNAPLILAEVKGSCTCTVPEWPKEPIAPGAKGRIKVKYNTNNAGPINKSVTITCNAVNVTNGVKVLRIKGNVAQKTDGTPVSTVGAPAGN